jgi:hypothetical protein
MTRKRNKRTSGDHGAAFVIGSLLGGLTGAVIALWKTPQSGVELRQRVAGPLGLKPHEPEPPVMPFIAPITNEPVPEPDSASTPPAGTVS